MTTGYRIEYKENKRSKGKYVCADLKNVNEIGYTWIHQESAREAKSIVARNMQVPIGRLKIRNIEMEEENNVKYVDPKSITFSLTKNDAATSEVVTPKAVTLKPTKSALSETQAKKEERKKEIKKPAEEKKNDEDSWLDDKYNKVLESVIELGTAITGLDTMIDKCNQIIQIEDLREQDFMHYIECRNLSASGSSHLFKVFKESRIKRRNAKDLKSTLMAIRNCQLQIKDAATTASMAKNSKNEYHPRVEKEIFK